MRTMPPLESIAYLRHGMGIACLLLTMWAYPHAPLAAQETAAATACDPAFLASYREMLALELGSRAALGEALRVECDVSSAYVRSLTPKRALARSVPLHTDDAARWLALAASELLRAQAKADAERTRPQPTSEPVTPATAEATRERFLLYAAARLRLGDLPLTLRAGAELGAVGLLRPWLGLELALRFTSGAHSGLGPVSVRAYDAGGALFVHYSYVAQRLRLLTGVGWTMGYGALDAKSRDPAVSVRKVRAAFHGPALALRLLVELLPRLMLFVGFEAAYLRPRIEGRDEHGDTLFRQRTWSLAWTLGPSVPF